MCVYVCESVRSNVRLMHERSEVIRAGWGGVAWSLCGAALQGARVRWECSAALHRSEVGSAAYCSERSKLVSSCQYGSNSSVRSLVDASSNGSAVDSGFIYSTVHASGRGPRRQCWGRGKLVSTIMGRRPVNGRCGMYSDVGAWPRRCLVMIIV